jgi:hypothetical protein
MSDELMSELFGDDDATMQDLDGQIGRDSSLPPIDNRKSMSLFGFCQRAKALLSLDQGDFVRFVLTGQDTDGRQACIDPVYNRVTQDDSLEIIRDYDSLLGISHHIRVNAAITINPIAKLEDTLSRNIHILFEFESANVSPFV